MKIHFQNLGSFIGPLDWTYCSQTSTSKSAWIDFLLLERTFSIWFAATSNSLLVYLFFGRHLWTTRTATPWLHVQVRNLKSSSIIPANDLDLEAILAIPSDVFLTNNSHLRSVRPFVSIDNHCLPSFSGWLIITRDSNAYCTVVDICSQWKLC